MKKRRNQNGLLGSALGHESRSRIKQLFADSHSNSPLFGGVPLVLETVRPSLINNNYVPHSALLVTSLEVASDNLAIGLSIDSIDSHTPAELIGLARDLIDPLVGPSMDLDIEELAELAKEKQYKSLGGVLLLDNKEEKTEFGMLMVPKIFQYELLDSKRPILENHSFYKNLSDEEVSTHIAAAMVDFVLEHAQLSLEVN